MITKIENENEEAFKVRDLPWICEKNVNTASNLQMKVMQLKTLLLKNEDENKIGVEEGICTKERNTNKWRMTE